MFILPYLDATPLFKLELTCKYFYINLQIPPQCTCQKGYKLLDTCTSTWAKYSRENDFTHEKLGSNLACRIVKKLYHRELWKKEAQQNLKKLYLMYCSQKNHLIMKTKSHNITCALCQQEVIVKKN